MLKAHVQNVFRQLQCGHAFSCGIPCLHSHSLIKTIALLNALPQILDLVLVNAVLRNAMGVRT